MELDKLSNTLNKPKQGKIGFNPERDLDDKSIPYAKLQMGGKISDSDISDMATSKLTGSITNQVNVKTNAGVPTGGADGDMILDITNFRIYFKINGAWKYASLT